MCSSFVGAIAKKGLPLELPWGLVPIVANNGNALGFIIFRCLFVALLVQRIVLPAGCDSCEWFAVPHRALYHEALPGVTVTLTVQLVTCDNTRHICYVSTAGQVWWQPPQHTDKKSRPHAWVAVAHLVHLQDCRGEVPEGKGRPCHDIFQPGLGQISPDCIDSYSAVQPCQQHRTWTGGNEALPATHYDESLMQGSEPQHQSIHAQC